MDTKCAGTFIIYHSFKSHVITYSSGLDQTLFSTHRLAAVLLITINLGCINFPKLYEPPENSIRQKRFHDVSYAKLTNTTSHSIKFSLRATLLLGFVHPCNKRYIVTVTLHGHTLCRMQCYFTDFFHSSSPEDKTYIISLLHTSRPKTRVTTS